MDNQGWIELPLDDHFWYLNVLSCDVSLVAIHNKDLIERRATDNTCSHLPCPRLRNFKLREIISIITLYLTNSCDLSSVLWLLAVTRESKNNLNSSERKDIHRSDRMNVLNMRIAVIDFEAL